MSNQDLIFACIEANCFNEFDGAKVVAALRKHADLWEAVIFHKYPMSELTLRDLPDDLYFDSLFIRSSGKDDKKLVALMKRLKADEIDWCDELGESFRGFSRDIRDRRVLHVWWD